MNVVIPTWSGRVSPVLDTAGRLLVVRVEGDREVERREVVLPAADLPDRVEQIAGAGVDVLICGAVSEVLEAMLAHRGIAVIPQVCGDVEEVLACYLAGEAPQDRFGMPGCCRRRRHRGGRRSGRCRDRWGEPR